MKESGLIDMFGLSGDPISNDQLDDLFLCLESDDPIAREGGSNDSFSPFLIVVTASLSESDNFLFHTLNERERTIRTCHTRALQ